MFLFLVAHLKIKDAFIKKFRSFSELKKYAKCAPDPELLGKIKVCTTPYILKRLLDILQDPQLSQTVRHVMSRETTTTFDADTF